MQRNLQKLADYSYDILVVGGGIYGACVAWEAVSRGLSVALVEKSDFGSATSANSLKIIHGGLRYLQHADFKRMRESIRERKTLLKIAPHLIHPLPILVPTYGHGIKGREAMSIALWLNDLISCDRNWSIDDVSHKIPTGKVISKSECLEKVPGLSAEGLTGGACFTDAQVYNSERLTLAFLQSADALGAQVANYAKVCEFVKQENAVVGAIVQDELTGQSFDIRAKLTINTAGPWVHELGSLAQGEPPASMGSVLLAKAVNIVVPKFLDQHAVGLSSGSRYRDKDALIDKGSRFLFAVPWRESSMLGTWYFPYCQSPDELQVSEAELQTCISDINSAYPSADLSLEDIKFVHCGLLPSKGLSPKTGDVQLSKHYQLIDHSLKGTPGLLSVSGVKYTTARDVAEKVIHYAGRLLGRVLPISTTHQASVFGGDIQDLTEYLRQAVQGDSEGLTESTLRNLIYTYGTEYKSVLSRVENSNLSLSDQILVAKVRYALQEEMAQHLSDVVLRRTDLGSAGKPSEVDINLCADTMAAELNWDLQRRQEELRQLERIYAAKLPNSTVSVATVSGR